jgi:hypothetical protein
MVNSTYPILFDNAAGRLRADAAGFLRVDWGPGPRTLTDTGALFAAITRGLLTYRWSKVLVNQVHMQPFTTQEQLWVAQEWLPHAVLEGGYRYGAVVVSKNEFTRLATAFITVSVQGLPVLYRSFDTEEQAVNWIIQQRG